MVNTIIVGCNTQVSIGPYWTQVLPFGVIPCHALWREVLDWTPERISSRLTQLTFLDQRWWQSDTKSLTWEKRRISWEFYGNTAIKLVYDQKWCWDQHPHTWEGNYMVDSLLNQGLLCQILMFMTWKAVRSIPAISAWELGSCLMKRRELRRFTKRLADLHIQHVREDVSSL